MSVTGLCQICESAPAQYECDQCGTVACATHFDTAMGLCANCAANARGTGQR